jgi:DNA-binding transcriptional ArsR family regulator
MNPRAKQIPHPVPAELAELIAQRFRVIGDAMRIRLLDSLREGELSVGELTVQLETSQQNVSKHLGILYAAGIVARRRDGNRILYSIADEGVFRLCEQVCGGLQRQLEGLDAIVSAAA